MKKYSINTQGKPRPKMSTVYILEIAKILCIFQSEYPQYTIEFLQKKNSGLLIKRSKKDKGVHIIKFEWNGNQGSPFLPDTRPNVILINTAQNKKRWGIHNNSIKKLNICIDKTHELYSLAENILGKITEIQNQKLVLLLHQNGV